MTMKFIKYRIFCALHRPVGRLQFGYHLLVIFHSFLTAFPLNVLNIEATCPISLVFTKYIDLFLAVILTVETILEFWCCSCIVHYQHFVGKLHYLLDNLIYKLIDLSGMIIYFLTFGFFTFYGYFYNEFLAVAHLIQLMQIYRITKRPVEMIMHTIRGKFSFIFSLFLVAVSVFLVSTHCIYLAEMGHNKKIKNITDASWLVFITMITVGFGDVGPVTLFGKIMTATYLFVGIVSFSIIITLFGAQLAGETEKSRCSNILSLVPAAVLIQNAWKLYYARKEEEDLKEEDNKLADRLFTSYLYKLRYLTSRKHFLVTQSDVNIFDENILFYEYLQNRMGYLEKSIYHKSHQLSSIEEQLKRICNTLE